MNAKIQIPRSWKELKEHFGDPLYRNSYFLLLATAIPSILGFVFWMIAARFYTPSEIGIVVALISAITLLAGFSRLGLEFGIIRYLPNEPKKGELINSCLTIIVLLSALLAIIFIIGSDLWTSSLSFIKGSEFTPLFIMFTVFFALTLFQQRVFLAFRRAEFTFFQTLTNSSLKLVLIPLFTSLGSLGLFIAWGLPTVIAMLLSLFVFTPYLYREYFPKPRVEKGVVNEMFHFSFGNYIAENLWYLPSRLFPLLIISILSAEMTAYFYIAWSIALILYVIPSVVGDSLFAEGSYNRENLKSVTISAIKFAFLILIPALFFIFIFGDKILLLFGRAYYENALDLLLILILAVVPFTFVRFYVAVQRVRGKVRDIVLSYLLIAAVSIGLCYLLMPVKGIAGVGVAWLLAQILALMFVGFRFVTTSKSQGRERQAVTFIRELHLKDYFALRKLVKGMPEEDMRFFHPSMFNQHGLIDIVDLAIFLVSLTPLRNLIPKILPQYYVIGYFYSDNLTGFAYLRFRCESASLGIYVDKQYRGRGIGRLLMQNIIDYAKKRKLSHIRLTVHRDNERAIKLYKSHGFKMVSEGLEEWKGKKYETLTMILKIKGVGI